MVTPAKPAKKSALAETAEQLNQATARLKELAKPDHNGHSPAFMYGGHRGKAGGDSQGFSVLKMAGYCCGFVSEDEAKAELDLSNRLMGVYKRNQFTRTNVAHTKSFLVPFCTDYMPQGDDEADKLKIEVKEKMQVQGQMDPDEVRWMAKRLGGEYGRVWEKTAMGTVSDTTGGVLVGFPTLGELVDLQRNMEVFPAAGATEIALPPNGRIQFPKLTGGATANWIGEGGNIPGSNQTTGNLDLVAKKLGVFVTVNNELFRFNTVSAEGMIRMDMSRVAALKADLGMLEGTGGTQIKGLITYDTQTSWTAGTDKLILATASTTGANGDKFQPEDPGNMESIMPDMVPEPTAWLMRKNFWNKIRNRRSDGPVPGDGQGPFMFVRERSAAEAIPLQLEGVKVVRSSQISNTRSKGSASNLTYVVLGYFPDWIIGRSGVLEFLASNLSDNAMQNDQTIIRAIEHIDAGPRHAASFVLEDQLLVA